MNTGSAASRAALDGVDARLVDHLQSGFPITDRPFARIGEALGLAEEEVLERLRALLSGGVLARLGPLYQIERAGGSWLLAALEVPPGRFEDVAAQVNAHLQVAHNLRREHRLNMWFVVAADSQEGVAGCLRAIEAETGLRPHCFPTEREFRAGLRLPVSQQRPPEYPA
jgi:DNA-binding Lrp family transcriptional regulator